MTNKKKVAEIRKFIETNFPNQKIETMEAKGKDRITYAVHGSQLFVGDDRTDDFIKSLLAGSQKAVKFWKSLLK